MLFNGAFGNQTFNKWDPAGFYSQNTCGLTHKGGLDPLCNYTRVLEDLTRDGYSPNQVQAVFLKSANPFPQCDMLTNYCPGSPESASDAYAAETYMGNIMRFLNQGVTLKVNGNVVYYPAPYPNLQQVFLTSRTYGGYAQNFVNSTNPVAGCLNPSPFDYEEGFAVQRLIVAQINGTPDAYSGAVDYNNAPWFDWGPYLWTAGVAGRSDQLIWCGGGNSNQPPCFGKSDVRQGDTANENVFWGDYTHPSYLGQQKVAGQLVKFLQGTLPKPQTHITDWISPWIGK